MIFNIDMIKNINYKYFNYRIMQPNEGTSGYVRSRFEGMFVILFY